MLGTPGNPTEINSTKYNRYHLFRKEVEWRQEAGSCVSDVHLNLASIARILKLPSSVFYQNTYMRKATKIINLKGMQTSSEDMQTLNMLAK